MHKKKVGANVKSRTSSTNNLKQSDPSSKKKHEKHQYVDTTYTHKMNTNARMVPHILTYTNARMVPHILTSQKK